MGGTQQREHDDFCQPTWMTRALYSGWSILGKFLKADICHVGNPWDVGGVRHALGCPTPLAAPRPWPSINTDETHSLYPPRTWAGLFLLRPFYSVINIFFNVQPW